MVGPRIKSESASTLVCLLLGICVISGASSADEADAETAVPFTMRSIGAGKQLYAGLCGSCHGVSGTGDTSYREFLKTPPADLTDAQWVYGSTDAEIFDVIKRGRLERDMPGFETQTSDERIWYLVHYVQYLAGKRPQ